MDIARRGNGTEVRDLVECSLLIAMVFISTRFINIRLPISINGGLIHLGNTMLFTSAIVFGKRKGMIAGGFGMALFDILSPWVIWAPFTFVIRGAMGYIVGQFAYKGSNKGENIIANLFGITVSGIIMIIGYYITEVVLYGNIFAPISSIPGNVIQIIVGAIFALPLSMALVKNIRFIGR